MLKNNTAIDTFPEYSKEYLKLKKTSTSVGFEPASQRLKCKFVFLISFGGTPFSSLYITMHKSIVKYLSNEPFRKKNERIEAEKIDETNKIGFSEDEVVGSNPASANFFLFGINSSVGVADMEGGREKVRVRVTLVIDLKKGSLATWLSPARRMPLACSPTATPWMHRINTL